MNFQHITFEKGNGVLTVCLHRQAVGNALDFNTITELKQAFMLAQDDETVKVIVLKANGEAFCAGLDLQYLKNLQAYGPDENLFDIQNYMELLQVMHRHKSVIIGVVQGPVAGAGLGLLLGADMVYATHDAKVTYNAIHFGLVPGPELPLLLRKIGEGNARQMLLTGLPITAAKAANYGLFTAIYEPEELQVHLNELIVHLMHQCAAGGLTLCKKLLTDLPTLPLPDAMTLTAKLSAHARLTQEAKFGVDCFCKKVTIDWQ